VTSISTLDLTAASWQRQPVIRVPSSPPTRWTICSLCDNYMWQLYVTVICDGYMWRLYGTAIWQSCDSYMTTICDSYMAVMWQLYDNYMWQLYGTAIWQSCDPYMTVVMVMWQLGNIMSSTSPFTLLFIRYYYLLSLLSYFQVLIDKYAQLQEQYPTDSDVVPRPQNWWVICYQS